MTAISVRSPNLMVARYGALLLELRMKNCAAEMRANTKISICIIPIFAALFLSSISGDGFSQEAMHDGLAAALTAARDEAQWPGLSLEDAQSNLRSLAEAIRFVREGVEPADYGGPLHGPEGALRIRAANQIDKALLFASLAEGFGYEVQIVSASGKAPPVHDPGQIRRDRPAGMKLAKTTGPSSEPITFDSVRREVEEESQDLKAIVDRSYEVLRGVLAREGWQPSEAVEKEEAEDAKLVWVEVRKDPKEEWKRYDVYYDGLDESITGEPIDVSAPTVVLSLVKLDSQATESELLRYETDTHQLSGSGIQVVWTPIDVRYLTPADIIVPLDIEVEKWQPSLRIGPLKIDGKQISATADNDGAPSRIVLRIELESSEGRDVFERTLQDFGAGFEQHEMLAIHNVGFVASPIPTAVVEARLLDETLDLATLRLCGEGKINSLDFSSNRAFSTRTASVVNDLIFAARSVAPDIKQLEWDGPTIFVETIRHQKKGEDVSTHVLLDVINASLKPRSTASVETKLKWGFAICEAEARLLGARSINRLLVENPDTFTRSAIVTGLVAEYAGSDSLVLTSELVPEFGWVVQSDGMLYGIASSRSLLQGKGARTQPDIVEVRSKAAINLIKAALGLSKNMPIGPLVSGLFGYFSQLRDAMNGLAGKMNEIANTIDTGETSNLNFDQKQMVEEIHKLLETAGSDFSKDVIKNVFKGALKELLLNHGPRGNLDTPSEVPESTFDSLDSIKAALETLAAP